MLECFENTVGSRFGCDTDEFTYYIEDLPGLDPDTLDKVVSGAYKDTKEFIDTKIELSKKLILEEIRAYLKPNVKLKTILDNETAGYFQEARTLKAAEANKYRGISLRASDSQHFSMTISSVTLYLSNTGSVNVLIYDVLTGLLKDTIAVSAVANTPTRIVVNKTYASRKQRLSLAVLISTANESYNTTIYANGQTCIPCQAGWYQANQYVQVKGVQIDQSTAIMERNLSSATHTNGISVDYTLNCDVENFLCSVAPSLSIAMWYRAGMEIARHCVLNFSRFNHTANANIDDFKAMVNDFGASYDSHMKMLFDNMKWPNDQVCFPCAPRVSTKVVLP